MRASALIFISLLATQLGACAAQRANTKALPSDPARSVADEPHAGPGMPPDDDAEEIDTDPYESYNRKIYRFNSAIDRAVLKPVAKAYRKITPDFVEKGVANFFRNLGEPTVIVNDLLQAKGKQFAADTGRFIVNSTVGVLGLFDVASHIGLDKHDEDFGQTLAVWGAEDSPYFVLPFFGPRTIRDSFGLVGDWFTDPITYIKDSSVRYGVRAMATIDIRAQLLTASKVLEQASDDEYLFVREAYLQKRKQLIYDGNVPPPGPADAPPGASPGSP